MARILVKELTTAVLADAALRRHVGDLPTTELVAFNLELIALALGSPAVINDSQPSQLGYASLHLTVHAYERLQALLRHILLSHQFESRDTVVAMNVLDMHAEALMNVTIHRKITNPFAGVDRRRLPRN